nr:MAG TPA: hypothetical protein [Caudoviricetes sp.]
MNESNQLISNIVGLAKNKIVEAALNNPEKIGQLVSEIALKSDATRTFLKSMDWSAESFGKTVQQVVSSAIQAYQNRDSFKVTDEERMEKFAESFAELCGYECLTPMEARILAAGYARFNGKEIQKIFKLEQKMTVEQVQKCAEDADKKFRQAATAAHVGVVGSEIEKSSIDVDLESIAKKLEAETATNSGAEAKPA